MPRDTTEILGKLDTTSFRTFTSKSSPNDKNSKATNYSHKFFPNKIAILLNNFKI